MVNGDRLAVHIPFNITWDGVEWNFGRPGMVLNETSVECILTISTYK